MTPLSNDFLVLTTIRTMEMEGLVIFPDLVERLKGKMTCGEVTLSINKLADLGLLNIRMSKAYGFWWNAYSVAPDARSIADDALAKLQNGEVKVCRKCVRFFWLWLPGPASHETRCDIYGRPLDGTADRCPDYEPKDVVKAC